MAWVIKDLFETAYLSRLPVTYFTAEIVTRIDELHLKNEASGVVVVDAGVKRADGSNAPANHIINPGETWDINALLGLDLNPGDTIWAVASANGVRFVGRGTFKS